MKLNILKISKLFYNKWPYKIACSIKGARRLSYLGVDNTRQFCEGKSAEQMPAWMYHNKLSSAEKFQLLQFTNSVEPFLDIKDQVQIRAEGSNFNFFCKDRVLLETICTVAEPWIVNIYGPDSEAELEFMLSNDNKKITCDQIPYEKYQFKIYLKNNMPIEKRNKFLEWSKNYQDRVLISKYTGHWMADVPSYRWTQCPFLYVEDAKLLTIIGLFLGGDVKKVEEFIPRSSINTILDQEQLCHP